MKNNCNINNQFYWRCHFHFRFNLHLPLQLQLQLQLQQRGHYLSMSSVVDIGYMSQDKLAPVAVAVAVIAGIT